MSIVKPFTELEKAVLHTICQRAPLEIAESLRAQIRSGSVLSRENTGAGFFTYLQTSCDAVKINDQVLGGVFANVDGLQNPISCILFIKGGRLHLLEGAATEDITTLINFEEEKFHIL